MNKVDYAEQRRDPKWQRKRLEIMERDGFKCSICESSEKTLNVHHSYYVTGRMPWEYPSFSLITMCRECHEFEHNLDNCSTTEDGRVVDYEWECELDWIFGGKPDEAGRFWPVAIRMEEIVSAGMDRGEMFMAIEKFLSQMRDEAFNT